MILSAKVNLKLSMLFLQQMMHMRFLTRFVVKGIEDASRAPTTSATPTPRFLIDVMSQGYYGDDDKLGREEVEALLDRSGTLPNAKDQLIVHSCPPPQQASVPIEEGNLGSNSSTSAVNAAGSVMDLLKNARM
jgi:hypothetical protein